jgi:hypothetical protein
VQALVLLCLDRQKLSWAAIQILKRTALLSNSLGFDTLSNAAFSGIFNLRYYQGMAEELGGRSKLLDGVMKTR